MRALRVSLIPLGASFLVLQPQPPPDFLTLVLVLVNVMSSSGVGAETRAVGGGGVMAREE